MTRLWDKGAPLDARVLRYTAGEDHALDDRLVAYDVQASIAHAEGLHAAELLSDADLDTIRTALSEIGTAHARGEWRVTLELEDGQTALENLLTQKIGAVGGRIHLGRSRNDQVLTALRLYMRDAVEQLRTGAQAVADALHDSPRARARRAARLHAHAAGDAEQRGAVGAGLRRRDPRRRRGLRLAHRRIGKNPLGSAAGYGTPGLPLDRHDTMRRLGFPANHEPVTAVQLSRGKAEAQVLFEIVLLMTDLGRLASDLMLFYTQEFAYVRLPDEFTTGSSIMPQKRNPDVFELVRGRTASAQACLHEALGVIAKLTSGYHRDLQLIKVPLFRGIDLALQTLDIVVAAALPGVAFRPENIRLDPSIHAAEQANRIAVEEGIPFREAYRRVGEQLREKK
jgi:argininosuccinate lyase